ncbi:MAG: 4'-phosphopantetheinyl transferase superfamily protein [Gemmatimonadota bacterium]|nr:4'-phosphopantetheinyl transferase superfamily protein [Gemmatimonadota bacterium]
MAIGNDVVDLTAARAKGMAEKHRFVERVFTRNERARILSGSDPDLEVWLAWAAKEAAYKVVSKLDGKAPVFEHRSFVVVWDEAGTSAERSHGGTVRHEGRTLRVWTAAERDAGYVHVLSWLTERPGTVPGDPAEGAPRGARWTVERLDRPDAPWAGSYEALTARLGERERDAVHSRPSAAVRIGARAEIASVLGIDRDRTEIVCQPGRTGRRPPRILVDGTPATLDVSLSHDGPWIAWALAPLS